MKKFPAGILCQLSIIRFIKLPNGTHCFAVNCLLILLLLFTSCQKKTEWQFKKISKLSSYEISDLKRVNDTFIIGCGGERYARGEFYFSHDNGISFSKEEIINKQLFGIDFVNADSFFACGYDGKILNSTLAGSDWNFYQHNYWRALKNILCVNDSTIISCGGGGFTSGIITRSHDGGATYFSDTFKAELRGLCVAGEQTIFCSGYGVIYRSDDAGENWQQQKAEGDFFVSIDFSSAENGIAVGLSGTILKTENGGVDWQKIRNGNSPINQSWKFRRVIFKNENEVYIAGDAGLLLKSTDGGNNWIKIKNTPGENIFSITLSDHGGIIGTQEGNIYNFLEE
ncbi:MAG TPA: hypothetical protein DCQ93_04090 [Bacteroidetes bacterium]|nr:hypothetical protein [Bacteroidota bacterium]